MFFRGWGQLTFTYYDLAFAVGFLLYFGHAHIKGRRRMLATRCVYNFLYAVYFFGFGAFTAAYAALIGVVGPMIQAVVPDHLMKQTLPYRFGISLVLAACGFIFIVDDAVSLLPMIGFMVGRFSELMACQQRIRMAGVVNHTLWISYAIQMGLLPYLISELAAKLSTLTAIWNHEQERKKLVLVPIPVASAYRRHNV